MKHAIVLVGFEPDWQALYIEGKKVAEGHGVSKAEVVEHVAAYMGRTGDLRASLEETHIEEYEMNQYGEIDIFDTLDELEKGAPGAFERISK